MPNLIPQCQEIEKWIRKGMPGGVQRAHQDIPVLLRRIRELENTLAPFARIAVFNKSVASKPDTLVHATFKDCQEAFNKLDPAQGVPLQQPQENAGFGEPATF